MRCCASEPGSAGRPVRGRRYVIRVDGVLDAGWSEWLCGLAVSTVETEGVLQTVIDGVVADQSALYGLLIKLNNLNLALVSLQREELEG